mgnify:CR=1 FL=1
MTNAARPARIIGIDVATDARKVGVALCSLDEPRPRLDEVLLGTSWSELDQQVAKWADGSTLLALDAPLGWPQPLAESLHTHTAGEPLEVAANSLFRRATDDVVAKTLGKRPLDVGADRIARTAHAALAFLGRLGERLGSSVPLAWRPESISGICAIEVYPAGTLAARGLPHSGYKGREEAHAARRQELVGAIGEELLVETHAARKMADSDHVLDAVLCAVAGLDFVAADVIKPQDLKLAQREGWIWVRSPRLSVSFIRAS